jgi:hypothetical protein
VSDPNKPLGFVSLKSVTAGKPDPAAAIAEIRQIYFKTTKRTIDNDLAHAIELVKAIPDEAMRSKVHVYMEGLAEMAREWGKSRKVEKFKSGRSGRSGKVSRRGKP